MKLFSFSLAALLLLFFSTRAQTSTSNAGSIIAGAETVIKSDYSAVPEYIRFRQGDEINVSNIIQWIKTSFGLSEQTGFQLLKTETDDIGMTHYRYRQTVDNIPVEGTMYIVHARGDKVISMNGYLVDNINITLQPALSENAALGKALSYMNAESYRWQSPEQEKELRRVTNTEKATWFPKGLLTVAPLHGQLNGESYRLAWRFDIYADKPLKREYVFVDAQNGEIIYTRNRIKAANAIGTATTAYSGSQKITTDSTAANSFRLRETGRGNGIETYNLKATTNYGSASDFTDADNLWNNVNTAKDQYATDAHWGAEKTYDFLKVKFNRNSIDNGGYKLVSYVHYSTGVLNAFWDGQEMSYGDGGGSANPLTSLDITGHEISHGLTENTSGLNEQGEAGALNEGFSDCMGVAIRHYGKQSTNIDWVIGDEIGGAAFRSLSNPKQFGNPDTYLGTNWDNVNQEVHKNSTIIGHWFYLLSQGGTGINDNSSAYTVTGIGIEKAQAICYRMNAFYLSPPSRYSDARTYAIQAAIDLYGGCTNEVIQTTNAWHAVGVGAVFAPVVVTSSFSASITSGCNVPVSIAFANTSSSTNSYKWYFGDGDSSTAPNPIHTYKSYGTFTVTLIADGGICGSATTVRTAYISLTNQAPTTAPFTNVLCRGATATLTATGVDTIKWYSSASGGSPLATGAVFTTPPVNATTTFYAGSDIYSVPSRVGPPDNLFNPGGYFTNSAERGLVFSCFAPCKLISVVVYAQAAGNRTINLRSGTGGIISSKTINLPAGKSTVTLNFDIPVGNNMQLGCGNNPNLFRNTGGANYPSYTLPGVISMTDNNVHISDNSQAQGYYYFFYDWNVQGPPCSTARTPVTVNISNGAAFNYSASGLSVTFTDSSKNPTSWLWKFGDGDTSTRQNPVHDYAAFGTYTATLIVESNGCTDTTYKTLTLSGTGLRKFGKNAFSIYPNPAGESFTVYGLWFTNGTTINIYNMMGERASPPTPLQRRGESATVYVGNLAPGIYFIKIEDENGSWIGKFVKE